MIMDLGWYNQDEYEEPGEFKPLPEGKYLCAIVASEEKPTKANPQNRMLQLKLQVLDGEYKGRNLWDRLNIIHKESADAQRIARGTLKMICKASKVLQPKSSADLHNIPMLVQVNVRKRADNGQMTNEIKGYFRKDEQKTEPAEAAATQDSAPWEK